MVRSDQPADAFATGAAGGITPTKTVETEARSAGIAWRTVRRASDDLGVTKRKGHGDDRPWYWSLPNLSTQLVHVVQSESLNNSDNMDGQVADEEPV